MTGLPLPLSDTLAILKQMHHELCHLQLPDQIIRLMGKLMVNESMKAALASTWYRHWLGSRS